MIGLMVDLNPHAYSIPKGYRWRVPVLLHACLHGIDLLSGQSIPQSNCPARSGIWSRPPLSPCMPEHAMLGGILRYRAHTRAAEDLSLCFQGTVIARYPAGLGCSDYVGPKA